jgi:hypothetical protein
MTGEGWLLTFNAERRQNASVQVWDRICVDAKNSGPERLGCADCIRYTESSRPEIFPHGPKESTACV